MLVIFVLCPFLYYNKRIMTQKIIKTGNSAAVTIPVEFFDALCLRYGDPAEATLDSEMGTITYRFPNGRQLPLGSSQKEKDSGGNPCEEYSENLGKENEK